MKSLKLIAAVNLLLSGFVGVASANTLQYVYIAGAPAIRQDSNTNINTYATGFTGGGLVGTAATTAGAYASANYNQWLIPNFTTGVDLIINAAWTGSTAAFESVTSGTVTQKFIPNANAGTVASPALSQTNTEAHQPDFGLVDTYQAATPFNGTVAVENSTGNGTVTRTYQALTANQLGVEPYEFVASPGAAAKGLTAVTTEQIQNLYEHGALPLAYFTGRNSDEGTLVYGLTRDKGSGARLTFQAFTGIGVSTALHTYDPTVTGATADTQTGNFAKGTISSTIRQWNPGNISSLNIYDLNTGDAGYAKFSDTTQTALLAAITSTPPTGALFIAYFNSTDGGEAVANGAEVLSYNGVTQSTAAIQEGQYGFWGYQWLDTPSTLTSQATTVSNALVANWVASIPTTSLNVYRQSEGGRLIQNY